MNLRIDRALPIVLALTLAIALANLKSATSLRPADFNKQVVFLCLSIVVIALVVYTPTKLWERLSFWIWLSVLVLLIAVLLVGPVVNGSRRWLALGGLRVQPSEFAKLAVILLTAKFMSQQKRHDEPWSISELLRPLNVSRPALLVGLMLLRGDRLGLGYWPLAVTAVLWMVVAVVVGAQTGFRQRLIAPVDLVLIPAALVYIEPDLGTSLVILACGAGVFWGAGIRAPSWRWSLAAVPVLGGVAWFAWNFMLLPYQKMRILGVINPKAGAQDIGYHTIQSVNAIANGGVLGQGMGAGAQSQTARLPEHHTDFIFAVLAEEWGLIGSLLVLALLATIVLLIIDGAQNSQSRFLEIFGYGVATLFSVQVVVNVGMVSGILPVVGMTLPLFSYGGSSLLSLSFALGLMIHTRSRRTGMA
ncbi:MAG: FtsW/RodA/SpoVE family cell cycle protein [Myxococcota bacterium]|nr:FtsW/RodA/SpoVE family cell cycle protein [Myxococcota bacterium]